MALNTFIQWKGTDVCMDFHCDCGHHNHIDGYFCYFVKCKGCGQVWKTPSEINLTKLDTNDALWAGNYLEDETTELN